MNALVPILERDGELVADSREVAAALEIQHENLLGNLDAHRATLEAEFGVLRFETGKPAAPQGGRPVCFAYLTENQALFVATLSRNTLAVVRVKAWLVKAFDTARRALSAPAPDFTDPLAVARLLQDGTARFIAAETAKRAAEHQLAAQAPAVAFARRVEMSEADISVGAFAKAVGWGPNQLHAKLRQLGFTYRLDGHPMLKQAFVEQGLFRVKQVPSGTRVFPVMSITGKGQLRLAAVLGINAQLQLLAPPAA